jgi:plasmid stability protein
MPTLYVENVPEEIYKALRKQARAHHKSMAAEVISLLEHFGPTAQELKRRQKVWDELAKLRAMPTLTPGPFPSAEEMIREDRER